MSNSSFLGQVKHVAGPLQSINSSEGKFNKVNVNVVTASTVTVKKSGVTEATVIGFAPTGYYTLASGAELTLVDVPGGYSPTGSGDTHLITLPAGSFVKSALIDDNGVTNTGAGLMGLGLGTYNSNITVSALTGANLRANPVLWAEGLASAVSPSGYVMIPFLGTQGGAPLVTVPASPGNFLNVGAVGAVTAGDFRATVTYYTLEDF